MHRSTLLRFLFICIVGGPFANADVKLAPVIASNMVLQRNTMVPVWGSAAPNEQITVEFKQQRVTVRTDPAGRWEARLSTQAASIIPTSMTVRGKSDTVVLTNILVGEVWLISGQSNMEFPMVGFPNYGVHLPELIQHRLDTDLQKADCTHIRLFRMALDHDRPTGKTDGWQVCDSASMASFSAVGYYFAKELRAQLDVPIGILEAAVGGTRIEPWTPSGINNQKNTLTQGTSKSEDPAETGSLFTRLVKPLVPYALRGVLWYQGEANVLAPGADTYTNKMRDLIAGWRTAWARPDLPFEYALLAPMRYTWVKLPGLALTEQSLPEFWEQQINASVIAHTGIISTNDLVDLSGPSLGQEQLAYIMDLIHPGDKWDVAHRFALVALAREYAFHHIVDSGPTVRRVVPSATSLQVDFEHAESGLTSKDGKPLTSFEIAGADMRFLPASARIDGKSVIVTSKEVMQPAAVRFGWNEVAQPNLFNQAGLPALPFRRMVAISDSR